MPLDVAVLDRALAVVGSGAARPGRWRSASHRAPAPDRVERDRRQRRDRSDGRRPSRPEPRIGPADRAASGGPDPCADERRIADERCALADRLEEAAQAAADRAREAQRAYDEHTGRSDARRDRRRPAGGPGRQGGGLDRLPPGECRRPVAAKAVEAAARDWLQEIDRINRTAQEAEQEAACASARPPAALVTVIDASRPRGRRRPDQRRDRPPRPASPPARRWRPARRPTQAASPGRPSRRTSAARRRGARPAPLVGGTRPRAGRPAVRRGRAAPRLRRRRAGASSSSSAATASAMDRVVAALAGDGPGRAAPLAARAERAGRRDHRPGDRGIGARVPRPTIRSGRCSARPSAATSRPRWPRSATASTGWAGSSTGASRASATCRSRSAMPGFDPMRIRRWPNEAEMRRALPRTSRSPPTSSSRRRPAA